ncbi:MAG TPA: FAD-dependent thymidylate synthase [Vicinamibacteria bacterium]|nr:FAD-dependent thymidylate synthase [Vicinamibacteria bacterium]
MRPEAPAFTEDERRALDPYFTNVDRPVFALRNLPEVVKAALFARYSRSSKSLRRLFLDEFLDGLPVSAGAGTVGVQRSEKLFQRVLSEYGDDSVAQLGGAHVAVEGASNLLTKVLEWGRLMAYLEQSTRYVPYTQRDGGHWRYVVPPELGAFPALEARYVAGLDAAFETYSRWIEPTVSWLKRESPAAPGGSPAAYEATVRARALDALRGLLPAATRSNVGIFGSGQAYEQLLVRLRAHPLAEARSCADALLVELRQVIPAFLTRVDRADRGLRTSAYLAETRATVEALAAEVLDGEAPPRPEVVLADHDPDGEMKVVAAALYPASHLPFDELLRRARAMSTQERARVLRACAGDRRANRRHRPGRAFEHATYRFDVVTDYGAFRDLQRHRLLTLDWQPLTPRHGYATPALVEEVGAGADWHRVMGAAAPLYDALRDAGLEAVASYALPMAYRIRFYMALNARAAMHLIELRTTPQGHPSYRRVCQAMHRLIAEEAGHHAVAEAMVHVDHSAADQGRLDALRAGEGKQAGRLV